MSFRCEHSRLHKSAEVEEGNKSECHIPPLSSFNKCAGKSNLNSSTQSIDVIQDKLSSICINEVCLIDEPQEILTDETIELASNLSPEPSGINGRHLRTRSLSPVPPPKHSSVRKSIITNQNPVRESIRSELESQNEPSQNSARESSGSIILCENEPQSKVYKSTELQVKKITEIFEPITKFEEDYIPHPTDKNNANINENSNNGTSFNECAGSSLNECAGISFNECVGTSFNDSAGSSFTECAGSSTPNSTQPIDVIRRQLTSTSINDVSLNGVAQDGVINDQYHGSNLAEEHSYLQNNEDNLIDVTMNGSMMNQNIEFNLTGMDQVEPGCNQTNNSDHVLGAFSVTNISNQQSSDNSKNYHDGINSKNLLVIQTFKPSKEDSKLNSPLKILIPCDALNMASMSISFSSTEIANTTRDQSTQTEKQKRSQILNQSVNDEELLKPSTSRDGLGNSTFNKCKNYKLLKKSKNNKQLTDQSNDSKVKKNPNVKMNVSTKPNNFSKQKKPKKVITNSQNTNQVHEQIKLKANCQGQQNKDLTIVTRRDHCCHFDSGSSFESDNINEDSCTCSDSDTSSSSILQHCDCSDCMDRCSSSCPCQSSYLSSSSSPNCSDCMDRSSSSCHYPSSSLSSSSSIWSD